MTWPSCHSSTDRVETVFFFNLLHLMSFQFSNKHIRILLHKFLVHMEEAIYIAFFSPYIPVHCGMRTVHVIFFLSLIFFRMFFFLFVTVNFRPSISFYYLSIFFMHFSRTPDFVYTGGIKFWFLGFDSLIAELIEWN